MSFLRNPGTNSIRYVREHTGYLGLLLEGEMEKQSWLIVTMRETGSVGESGTNSSYFWDTVMLPTASRTSYFSCSFNLVVNKGWKEKHGFSSTFPFLWREGETSLLRVREGEAKKKGLSILQNIIKKIRLCYYINATNILLNVHLIYNKTQSCQNFFLPLNVWKISQRRGNLRILSK